MPRHLFAEIAVDRCWQRIRQLLCAASPARHRRRNGVFQFKLLEARRVMYGADVLGQGEGEPGVQVEEFALTDVNPNSVTFNQPVSPRDFLQQASAWYFGHST